MDNYYLRSTILKLLDRLGTHDRERLHFILANDVPRRIRDDQTSGGTLYLMESLFDQEKLSEANLTILFNAFTAINCKEGIKILKEHKKKVRLNSLNQRTSTCIDLTLSGDVMRDQEEEEEEVDKSTTQSLLCQVNNYGNQSKIIKNTNTNYNPVTINLDAKQMMSSFSGEEHPFYISFKMNKCLFSMVALSLLIFVIVMIVLIWISNPAGCATREKTFLEEKRKLETKIQSLQNLLSGKDQQITRFEEEKNYLPIKPGQRFGGTDGTTFDDSSSSDFTYSHYLNGLLVRHDNEGFETYQFFYYSHHAKYPKIQSQFHGKEDLPQRTEFDFEKDEKIDRVEGQIVNKTFISENGTEIMKPVITGIKFITNKNHANPLFNDSSGINFNESFPGYTLGYVTGRSSQYIEQIQFFWYRT